MVLRGATGTARGPEGGEESDGIGVAGEIWTFKGLPSAMAPLESTFGLVQNPKRVYAGAVGKGRRGSLELLARLLGVLLALKDEARDEVVVLVCRVLVDDEAEARVSVRAERRLSQRSSRSAVRP